MSDESCPTCGGPVHLVSSDEGTAYYEPEGGDQLRNLHHRVRRLEALLHEAATALEMGGELSQQRKGELADEFRAMASGA